MPRAKPAPEDGLTKFQRYRRARIDKGMKLLRVWVPDPARPEFAKEAARQARLLRGRPEEAEALTSSKRLFPGLTGEARRSGHCLRAGRLWKPRPAVVVQSTG